MAEIRERRAEDLPGCVAAMWAVREVDGYPSVWPGDPAAFLDPPHVAAWVAVEGEAVVGHVVLLAQPLPAIVRLTGRPASALGAVGRLFTVPAVHGAGVGRRLLDTGVARSRAEGLLPVLDVVATSTAAVTLYERAGWTLLGQGPATWTDPDGSHPTLSYYQLGTVDG